MVMAMECSQVEENYMQYTMHWLLKEKHALLPYMLP
jgi:hypothetical protein